VKKEMAGKERREIHTHREFDRKWSSFGEVQSCGGREKWLPRLSPFSALSPCLTFSLFPIFLDFCSKRRVAEMSLWAGLLSPTLKAVLAKKRKGTKKRVGRRKIGGSEGGPSTLPSALRG